MNWEDELVKATLLTFNDANGEVQTVAQRLRHDLAQQGLSAFQQHETDRSSQPLAPVPGLAAGLAALPYLSRSSIRRQ